MSKPNRYRTDKDDDRETEPSRKGHHGLALLILILLAGVVVWFWLARDPEAREEFSNRMASLRESAINLAADLMSRTTTPPSPPDVGAVAGNSLPGAPPKYRSPIETPAELDEALAEQRPVQPGRSRSTRPCGPRRTGSSRCGAQGRSSRAHRLYRRFGFMARFPLCPRSDPGPERKAFRKPAGSKSPLWNGDDRPRMDRR